jgi:hypothetical protein
MTATWVKNARAIYRNLKTEPLEDKLFSVRRSVPLCWGAVRTGRVIEAAIIRLELRRRGIFPVQPVDLAEAAPEETAPVEHRSAFIWLTVEDGRPLPVRASTIQAALRLIDRPLTKVWNGPHDQDFFLVKEPVADVIQQAEACL